MKDIKVGEYVRTYNGLIGQVVQITDYSYVIRIYNGAEYVVRAVITKHSFNITDLIEVGDIVNGKEIKYVKGDIDSSDVGNPKDFAYNYYDDEYGVWRGISEDQVKTILTSQQYEANCYKVKGE